MSFNLNDYEASTGGAIPAGTYKAEVEKTELCVTTEGSGKYIKARFTVTGESHNGQKFFPIFNVVNKNETAVKIGMGQIRALVEAAGGTPGEFGSYEELADAMVGLEAMVKLKVFNDGEYGEKNKIVSFKPVQSDISSAMGADETNMF